MNKERLAKASVTINAPVEKVWGVLIDFDTWPQWQKQVTWAEFDGTLTVGAVFRWKAGGMRITSTLTEVTAPNTITWEGKASGMRAVHSWTLEQHGDETLVFSEDRLSGWLVSLLSLFSPSFFEKALAATLVELKQVSEK